MHILRACLFRRTTTTTTTTTTLEVIEIVFDLDYGTTDLGVLHWRNDDGYFRWINKVLRTELKSVGVAAYLTIPVAYRSGSVIAGSVIAAITADVDEARAIKDSVEDLSKAVAARVTTASAITAHPAWKAFPAWDDGEMGMMKGGGLGTVGYSPDGHAKQPRTFSDCRVGGCRRCCSVPNRVRVPPIVIDIHVLCMRVLADG